MRAVCGVLGITMAAILGGASTGVAAPTYPWCTTGAGHEFGARNCGFMSFEQCMQTARGNGQNCERNPLSVDQENAASQTRKKTGTQPTPSR